MRAEQIRYAIIEQRNVAAQRDDPHSMPSLYRRRLAPTEREPARLAGHLSHGAIRATSCCSSAGSQRAGC